MIETVLAVLIITSAFLCLFKLAHMLTGKIMLQHAAMRAARARSVGFNDFMCRKAANVAVIPVAGKRLWPTGDDAIGWDEELARIADYMMTFDWPQARGVLEYEHWGKLGLESGDGTDAKSSLRTDWFELSGRAGVENHHLLYMSDQGR